MQFEKVNDGLYKIHVSQQEIDRTARIIYRFRTIEENLEKSKTMLNWLDDELLKFTKGFLD